MIAPKPFSRPHFHLRLALGAALVPLVGAGAFGLGTQSAKKDQVLWRNSRGQTTTLTGVVLENTLSKVVLDTGDRQRDLDTTDVERVVFGDVPPSYLDGEALFDRGDFENAAAQFGVAAGDGATRPVVQAAARLFAARAWMRRGVADSNAFGEAKSELDRFLADHADNREYPEARTLLGRATWLGGDAAGAAEIYRSLYQEIQAGGDPTPGYSHYVCYDAGLSAAEAFLDAGDVDTATALFAEVASGLATVLASLAEDDPTRDLLSNAHASARLGEGFCLLAKNNLSQAKTFFQGQLNESDLSSAQRLGAQLGLAETLFAEGNYREAQIGFARVSALDHAKRDRVARALVGLAECALKLTDTDGRKNAKRWLDIVRDQYGDTPSAKKAAELSTTL